MARYTRGRVKLSPDPEFPGWNVGRTYAVPTAKEEQVDGTIKEIELDKEYEDYPSVLEADVALFTEEAVSRFEYYGVDITEATGALDFAIRNAAQGVAATRAKVSAGYATVTLSDIKDDIARRAREAKATGNPNATDIALIGLETDSKQLRKAWVALCESTKAE